MVPSFVSWWAMTIGNDALEVKSQLRFVIRLSLVVVVLLKGPCLCARLKGYASVKDLFVLLKSKQPKVYETFDLSSPSTWCQYIFQEAAALDGYLFSRLTFSSNTRLPSHHDGFVGWSHQEEGKKKKDTSLSFGGGWVHLRMNRPVQWIAFLRPKEPQQRLPSSRLWSLEVKINANEWRFHLVCGPDQL